MKKRAAKSKKTIWHSPDKWKFLWIGSGVFALALLLRVIYVCQWFDTPYGAIPFLDAQAYNDWARDIAGGNVYRGIAFYLSPMLAYILGLLYAIFGYSLWIPSLMNALLGAGTCVLLARLAFLAFGPVAAVTTGILAAAYKPFIFYTPPIMKECLVLFLLAAFLNFAYDAFRNNKLRTFLLAGLTLGLCTIVRGNVLSFAPVILLYVYWRNRPGRLKKCGAFALGVALAILPVTLHNAIASHDFVLLSYSDGFNAYIGHNPKATGVSYVFPPEVTSSPKLEEYDITHIAARELGHSLKPSEVSNYWRGLAIDYVLANPGREAEMLIDKIRLFWNNFEPFDNYDMGFIGINFGTLMSLPLPCFGLLVFLAVFAGVSLRKTHKTEVGFFVAFTLLYMATLFPFYVTDRYRLPVVLCFLPLAGAAAQIVMNADRKKIRAATPAIVLAALALGFTLLPAPSAAFENPAFHWSVLATIYEDEGNDVAAIESFNRAMSINRNIVGADAWIKVSDAKAHLGDRPGAEQVLLDAMKIFPRDGSVTYNYGRMKLDRGDDAAAFAAFTKAIEQMPTFTASYRGLAVVYDHFGNRAKAIEAVKRGLAIAPTDDSLNEVMGQLRAEVLR